MPRYIDAEELKATVKANDWSNPCVPIAVNMIIDRSPSADVVEVVRCKDCDFSRKTAESDELVRCRITGYRRELEHFCAYGAKGGESHD